MTHKMIGKTLLFLFCLLSLTHHKDACTGIYLSCLDAQQRPCHNVTIGERYQLEVRLEGAPTKSHNWPQVSGLSPEWVVGRQQRQETLWRNSKQSTATYFIWEVIFNKVGTVTLTASYSTLQGQQLATPSLSLTVHEQTINQSTAHASTSFPSSTFVRWESERLDPFVGEVFPVQLVLYTNDQTIHIESISEINLQNADLALSQQAEWGNAVHNGLSYKTATWKGCLCIQKEGMMSLPAVSISYRTPHRGGASRWAMMQFMLSPFASVEVKRTAPLSFNVRSLPYIPHEVSGVGIVQSITRQFNKPEIECGEAGSLTYTIQGNIHPSCLSLPEVNLSESAVKVYTTPATHTGEFPSYTYTKEFVIHPTEPTVIQFSEQALWFFNPYTERYDCIKIPPCEIAVRERIIEITQTEDNHTTAENVCENAQANHQETAMYPQPGSVSLPLQRSWQQPVLPLSWFLLCFLLPCIVLLSKQRCFKVFYKAQHRLVTTWRLRKTLRNINTAIHTQNAYLLLQTMQSFVQQQYSLPANASAGAYIATHVLDNNRTPELREDWQKLWAHLQKCTFGTIDSTEELAMLGTHCKKWVSLLIQLQDKGVA